MNESSYISRIRAELRELAPALYALKTNLPYTAGVADCWYSGPRGDLWVEYKWYQKLPTRIDLCGGERPKLTRLQQKWLLDRHSEGRQVGVIVGSTRGGVIYPGTSWQTVLSSIAFVERAVPYRGIAHYIANRTWSATGSLT